MQLDYGVVEAEGAAGYQSARVGLPAPRVAVRVEARGDWRSMFALAMSAADMWGGYGFIYIPPGVGAMHFMEQYGAAAEVVHQGRVKLRACMVPRPENRTPVSAIMRELALSPESLSAAQVAELLDPKVRRLAVADIRAFLSLHFNLWVSFCGSLGVYVDEPLPGA